LSFNFFFFKIGSKFSACLFIGESFILKVSSCIVHI
jgi:hypothetical protein